MDECGLSAGSSLTGRHIRAQTYTANAVQRVNLFTSCGMAYESGQFVLRCGHSDAFHGLCGLTFLMYCPQFFLLWAPHEFCGIYAHGFCTNDQSMHLDCELGHALINCGLIHS